MPAPLARTRFPRLASAGVRPLESEVLHFSEDPAITEFVPHVARTARVRSAYVWAVDAARAPDYNRIAATSRAT
jgi:hypothetical protein